MSGIQTLDTEIIRMIEHGRHQVSWIKKVQHAVVVIDTSLSPVLTVEHCRTPVAAAVVIFKHPFFCLYF